MQRAIEATDRRGLVQDAATRRLVRSIVNPCQLGQMGEMHLLVEDYWRSRFAQSHARDGGGAMTVAQLRRWIARELLGRDLDTEMAHWVYIGDSTNDQSMFEAFPHSVGVANIRRFEAELSHKPRYITEGERGAGFAEVAAALLDARQR